ncbi:hypothetical protein M2352_003819 [Azospirillum fermentarium]|uniref:hypothetical protein n=1 Tax=Azospirillum fermentarium TaxID=1233114 RepID=UPI002225F5A2|nr:hypothetical protein [Azospirillum fermentarium]MCW2248185.1 hypothetical protein [Azospirillum fermentarium]
MVSSVSILSLTATVRTTSTAATARSGGTGGTAAPATAPPATGAKKDFATVAQDARTAIDAAYAARGGKEGDIHTNATEWRQILGGMDRRSLYAVFSNAGGQFSDSERAGAEAMMGEDYMRGIGLDANDPMAGATMSQNPATYMKAAVKYWESVSDEEKQSPGWAYNRASSQINYELIAARDGEPVEKFDSDHPLVKVIRSALTASLGDPARERSTGAMNTLDDLLGQPWAKGFEQQMKKAAKEATQERGGFLDNRL